MSWRTLQLLTIAGTVAFTGCTNRTLLNWGKGSTVAAVTDQGTGTEPQATYEKPSGIMAAANEASIEQLLDQAEGMVNKASDDDTATLVEARSLFQAALKKRPNDVSIHHNLAIVSDKLNDFNQAEQHYRAALRKQPRDPNLLSDLGFSYFLQERYREAEEQLQKAIRIDPAHPRAATNLGALHAAQGHRDEALSWFQRGGSEEEAAKNMAVFFKDAAGQMDEPDEELVHNVPPEIRPSREKRDPNLPRIVAGASAGASRDNVPGRPPVRESFDEPVAQSPAQKPANGQKNPFESFGMTISGGNSAPASSPAEPHPFSATAPAENISTAQPSGPNPFADSVVNQRPVSPLPRNTQPAPNQPTRFAAAPVSPRSNDAIRAVKPDTKPRVPSWPHSPVGDEPPAIVARGNGQGVAQALHSDVTSGGVDPASGSVRTVGGELPQNPFETAAAPTTQFQPNNTAPAQPNPFAPNGDVTVPNGNVAAPAPMNPAAPAIANPFGQQPAQPATPQPTTANSPDAHAQWVGMNAGPGAMFPFGKARPVVPQAQSPTQTNQQILQNLPAMPSVEGMQGQINNGMGQIRNAVQTRVENAQGEFDDLIRGAQNAVPTANYEQADATIQNATQTLQQYGQNVKSQAGQTIQPYRNQAGQAVQGAIDKVGQQFNNANQQLNQQLNQTTNQVRQAVDNFPLPTINPGSSNR